MDYEQYDESFNEFPAWLLKQMEQTTNPKLKTLEGVGRAAKVSRTSTYNWISPKDTCRPRAAVAMRLAKLFGRPVEEVLSSYRSRKPGRKKGT